MTLLSGKVTLAIALILLAHISHQSGTIATLARSASEGGTTVLPGSKVEIVPTECHRQTPFAEREQTVVPPSLALRVRCEPQVLLA